MRYFFSFFIVLFVIVGSTFLLIKKDPYYFYADINGTKIGIESFDGEYKAVYFGYLFCPDICPSTLFKLSEVLKELNRSDFKLVFITIDPERDTNEELTQMAQNFYDNAIGLKINNLKYVAKNYGVKYQKIEMPDSAMRYSVAHSSSIYLLDKKGKFFTEISNLTTKNIRENLQNLIKQRP
ncbi:SCO family protein [Campylobacter sp. 9BO]|uniref:SCO family protein n=1 Tax=Campylobacter sp. 9BO TaxID=3424759 RepID=UPI003D32A4B0